MKNQQRQDIFDVVIIGGGLIGVSAAYFIACAGHKVCVVEKGVVGGEASGRSGGGIGQSHRTPEELPLAMHAVELWKQFFKNGNIDFEYRQHGNLRLAWSEEDVQVMKAMVKREQAEGLDCRWLEPDETKTIAPFVQEGSYLGSVFTPSDGSADPYLATFEIGAQARRAGAAIYEHRPVEEIMVKNGRVTGVETKDGSIFAPIVVNATNAWVSTIKIKTSYRVPVKVCRSQISITEQLPKFIGPFMSCNRYGYYRQSLSGNILLGFQSQPVGKYARPVTFEAMEVPARRISSIIPRLTHVSVIRAFTGFTAWSPDYKPFIGPLKDPEGLIIAAVFNGLGFAAGPAFGEMVAECALGEKTTFPTDIFDPYRFEGLSTPEGFTGNSWQGI
ncbi:MAG: FAD-binding oxidoreductase [Anaerolineales bacterium]|nr:FAD-binding oxidoreductase [Anaerolineales bacterium]